MRYKVGDIVPFEQIEDATDYVNSIDGCYYLEDYKEDENGNMQLIVRQLVFPKPTFEEQVEASYKAFDSNVEKRLNDFAATRRYASIYTACNARDSHIEKYAAEGEYCLKMWGETYAKCEELLAEYMPAVLAGERPIPTWEEVEAHLPALVWPDEQIEEADE